MLQVKKYKNGDEIKIINLFQKTFSQDMSIDYWKWNYDYNEHSNKYIKLMFDENTLAGHYAVIPINFKIYNQYFKIGLSMTTMTSPEYKKRGIFVALAKELYKENYNKIPLIYGFPNNNSFHGFTKYLGWKHVTEIAMYRCPTRNLNVKGFSGNIEFINKFDYRFDKLFDVVKDKYEIICCRNKGYLNWRYRDNPQNKYLCFTYKVGDSFLGYCVYKLYNDGVDTYCDLVDIISVDDKVFVSLVSYLINFMHDEGINNINFWNSDNSYLEIAKNLGFHVTDMITHFGVRVNCDFLDDKVQKFSKWYITMSDSDVF